MKKEPSGIDGDGGDDGEEEKGGRKKADDTH